MTELKHTPLYGIYKEYGAKTIDFGGWELPVQFSSIKEEHNAVRTRAGIFDVSHMGEVEVSGKGSLAFLQKVVTNDVSKLKTGHALYTAMCYENGGTVDDLLIYKKSDNQYLLVVNAANIEKDVEWLISNNKEDVSIKNISDEVALLAIQGPFSEKILQKLTEEDLSELTFFTFKENAVITGAEVLVSRTGYTGEDGFEIYCSPSDTIKIWENILEAGKEDGILPCGLGARDTLRFEAGLPLYGQELTKDITPIEAGIGFAVKINKEADFNGKNILKKQKENGPARRLIGIELIDKGIPRHGYEVFADGIQIGTVTSGTQSPSLKKNIGLALVKSEYAKAGTVLEIQVRKKRLQATVIPTPFYKRTKK